MVKHGTFYVPTIYVGDYYANSGKLLAQGKNDDPYLSSRMADNIGKLMTRVKWLLVLISVVTA